ncbi:MAG: S9 family peptidase [Bryobacteraceae bacterium]|nr:S9 family peptidase [Bryobacteraceae bacterium]
MRQLLPCLFCVLSASSGAWAAGLAPADLTRLRSVGEVSFSPDGRRIAYTVQNNDTDGKPYSQLWVLAVADGRAIRLAEGKDASGSPEWSPDGSKIAYSGKAGGRSGLIVAGAEGAGARWVSNLEWTNNPLPSTGRKFAWSPDGKRIAFVNAVPGPETAEAGGDPMVITRYLYKPEADEGLTRFNDNRRLHIFIAELASGAVRQLTEGHHYEHSIDWSPNGDEIVFASNREPNEDQFFNYDLLTVRVADGALRRLTATESIEYRPRWSPDGKRIAYQACKRGLTNLETTMEDTHVWLVDADGGNRREISGAIDNRQGAPEWSPEGDALYFTAQERGNVRLYRMPADGGSAKAIVADPGSAGAFSVARGGVVAYAFTAPSNMAELFLKEGDGAPRQLTELNREALAGKEIAPTEAFTFVSNDNKWEIEAFLTRPLGMTADSRHPMIVVIHGGPHAQQGPAFNLRSQVYAAKGWATLMVNYRGSTGYGQSFADAVFGDQNGNEAQDVLYGVSAAMRRNLWIDRNRIGVEGVSYGGQLSAWLITQTRLFKSSIPTAAITNLVSYNYTTYYNQYEQMTFGIFPHQGNLMDELWKRSALRYVAQAATPTMLVHGENDNDVPITEAEQYYIALKDVGVETTMVRYPREGHGIREVKHVIDWTERSIRWHESH